MPQQGGLNGAESPAMHPFPAGAQRQTGACCCSGSPAASQSMKSRKSMRAFMVFFIFSCSRSARCAIRISLSDTCMQCTRRAQRANGCYTGPWKRHTQQIFPYDARAGPTLVAQDTICRWGGRYRYLEHTLQGRLRRAAWLPATSGTPATVLHAAPLVCVQQQGELGDTRTLQHFLGPRGGMPAGARAAGRASRRSRPAARRSRRARRTAPAASRCTARPR